jgi:TonB family protein
VRVPAGISKQTARRLMLAIAGSIGIHALAVGMYGPAGAAAPAIQSQPAIHASLAPSQLQPSEEAPADTSKSGGASAGDGGTQTGSGLPSPDRWFKRSELDTVATPVTAVKLDYPEATKSSSPARIEVRLFIDERGIVRKTAIESPGPERAFDDAAMRAWHHVRFSPATKDGSAVKSQQVIEVAFQPELAWR